MPEFANRLDAIPLVSTTAERGTLFPSPSVGQRVQNAETGAVERYTGTVWNQPGYLYGSATFDPASLVDGAGETTTVTVTGAVLGDFAMASFSVALTNITVTAWVSASNTVSVRFQNESGGTVDLASGTMRALVLQRTVSS